MWFDFSKYTELAFLWKNTIIKTLIKLEINMQCIQFRGLEKKMFFFLICKDRIFNRLYTKDVQKKTGSTIIKQDIKDLFYYFKYLNFHYSITSVFTVNDCILTNQSYKF